jgi:transcriptional regulator with XRE-family HTH domain
MTQADLARHLNLTRSSVNAWEQETSSPSIESIAQLSDEFHVTTDYLIGVSDEMTISIEKYGENERELILRMLRYFDEVQNPKPSK